MKYRLLNALETIKDGDQWYEPSLGWRLSCLKGGCPNGLKYRRPLFEWEEVNGPLQHGDQWYNEDARRWYNEDIDTYQVGLVRRASKAGWIEGDTGEQSYDEVYGLWREGDYGPRRRAFGVTVGEPTPWQYANHPLYAKTWTSEQADKARRMKCN